jgi:hypothetical protein
VAAGGAVDCRQIVADCLQILSSTWREVDGFCPPNPTVYPHQWLWDSCFHAIAWGCVGRADRGVRELESCLDGQLANGFVPHMRYTGPTVFRGPLQDRSSYTQPPIYAHAARRLATQHGARLPASLISAIEHGLEWLWRNRMTGDGLIYLVHPWESGADDSPRWDSWSGRTVYDKQADRAHDQHLVEQTVFDDSGAAISSGEFIVAPAAFNAFAAHAATELAALTRRPEWSERGRRLAEAIDTHLWDESQDLWVDLPIVGGGESSRAPTLDGLFGALSTPDPVKANRALAQCADPDRFAAPYGLSYLPHDHPQYDPRSYWRGPAWPQLNYMMSLAARRWRCSSVQRRLADWSVQAAIRSRYAEYWDPETGTGLGARPQGWATLASVYATARGDSPRTQNVVDMLQDRGP